MDETVPGPPAFDAAPGPPAPAPPPPPSVPEAEPPEKSALEPPLLEVEATAYPPVAWASVAVPCETEVGAPAPDGELVPDVPIAPPEPPAPTSIVSVTPLPEVSLKTPLRATPPAPPPPAQEFCCPPEPPAPPPTSKY